MNILFTGATGNVGRRLGIALAEKNHSITIVVRNKKKALSTLAFPAKIIEWDFRTPISSANNFLQNQDAVIHLAGEGIADKRWTAKRKMELRSSRIDTTKLLIQAAASLPKSSQPKTWINASAVGFYGDRGEEVITEQTQPGKGFLPELCRDWENACVHENFSTRLILIRIGLILDPRSGFLETMLKLFRANLGGSIGSGKQWTPWIAMEDIVGFILFAIEHQDIKGAYNLAAPNLVRINEFTKLLSKKMDRFHLFPAPEIALKTALGELSQLAIASMRMIPERILKETSYQYQFDTLGAYLEEKLDYQSRYGVNELFTETWIPKSLDEVFSFFSDEYNLEKLTPEFLHFKVLGKNTPKIQKDCLIDYSLKIHGFPVKWRTKIETWDPMKSFTDTQLKGPYALWHHTHEFKELAGGVYMSDRVLYKLPVWPFGIIAKPLVDQDIKNIFSYRGEVIRKLYGTIVK